MYDTGTRPSDGAHEPTNSLSSTTRLTQRSTRSLCELHMYMYMYMYNYVHFLSCVKKCRYKIYVMFRDVQPIAPTSSYYDIHMAWYRSYIAFSLYIVLPLFKA